MNRMRFHSRSACLVAFVIVAAGIGCQHDTAPPWPPELDLTMYADAAAEIEKHELDDHQTYIKIAGVRIAPKGIYVDLICKTTLPPNRHEVIFKSLGSSLSFLRNPTRFVEIRDSLGERPNLMRMRHASPPTVLGFIPMPIGVHYRDPPLYSLDKDEHTFTWVQVCMWRTSKQLSPGQYDVRLVDWPFGEDRWYSALDAAMDLEWQRLQVDVASFPENPSL